MRFVAVLLTGLAFSTGALAQEGAPGADITAVIGDQLADFNARDVEGAWDHASETIRDIFGTPGNFGMMVQNGYPMVWTNDGADYLDLRPEADGRLWQRVRLRDDKGVPHLLDYAMIDTPDGWKIDAVTLLPAPDVGV